MGKVTLTYWETNAEYQTVAPYGVKITGKSLVSKEVETKPSDFGGYYYMLDDIYYFAHVADHSFQSCKNIIENDLKNMYVPKWDEDLNVI